MSLISVYQYRYHDEEQGVWVPMKLYVTMNLILKKDWDAIPSSRLDVDESLVVDGRYHPPSQK